MTDKVGLVTDIEKTQIYGGDTTGYSQSNYIDVQKFEKVKHLIYLGKILTDTNNTGLQISTTNFSGKDKIIKKNAEIKKF